MDNVQVFPANEFSMALAYLLLDLSIPVDLVARLNHIDFARATYVHIITSVPTGGDRQDAYMNEYVVLRLAKVINQLHGSKPTSEGFDPDTRLYCMGFTSNDMVDVGIAFHTQAQVEACRYSDQCAQHIMTKRSVFKERDFPQDVLPYFGTF
ncbi:hypothetical protein GGI13_000442 [Coemansia sp. RSA 455]|nr:hypothetical protein GGI13_000442 [Coemansia sp. RSA 455]